MMIFAEMWYTVADATSMDVIIDSINTYLIQTITMFRFWNMAYHKSVYKKLAKATIESPYFDISTKSRKALLRYWVKKNESYLKLLLLIGNLTLACWFLYPLLDDLEYNLFITIHTPFFYKSRFRYVLTYIVFWITFYYISNFIMANDIMMQAHLLHLACQLEVLSDCIKNTVKECQVQFQGEPIEKLIQNNQFVDVYLKRLGDIVNQHRFILRNIGELSVTLSTPMLGQLMCSGILIAFIGYQATTTFTENLTLGVKSCLYLSYNLAEFYVICRWCEEITNQTQAVGEAAYFSSWEYGLTKHPSVKSNLMLIIARANKPVIFTAGGMYNLTLESYTKLVKTSYSALTVLLRFRKS
ncbi:hypothetical protein evm_011508 [Chilo suppressalis]|nr:hypothetical protein evm_011508 [Chilo suppressalis]